MRLTGSWLWRAGLPGNASETNGDVGLPNDRYTLAELFKSVGYNTAHIGKWHLGYKTEMRPNAQGFDYSFGHMVGCIDNYSHYFYWNGPNKHDLYRNGKEVFYPGQYFPDLMVKEAGEFMEKSQQDPFFIYFAINMPHYPYQGDPKWLDYYNKKGVPYPRNLYAAFMTSLDDKIGDLLQKVNALGLANNTIIIFQSDNGYSTEERAHFGGGSAGVYRGAKASLFEGGIRVPSIISWPGKVPKGQVRNQFAVNTDWFPTLAEYCNIKLPRNDLDGKSLVSVINSACAALSTSEFDFNEISLYPNPTNSKIYITSKDYVGAYEIINTLGQKVSEGIFNSVLDEKELDLSSLQSGLYILNFKGMNSYKSIRIIKQ